MPLEERVRNAIIDGSGPELEQGLQDEGAQRMWFAQNFARIAQSVHPIVALSMSVVGLAFLCDEYGVSRERVIDALREAQAAEPLIYSPNGNVVSSVKR